MSAWLAAGGASGPVVGPRSVPHVERLALACLDRALALLVLVLGLPSIAVIAAMGHWREDAGDGRGGWQSRLAGWLGRRLLRVAADVFWGRLSWVGPSSGEHISNALRTAGVKPGVVSLYSLRRATAVDYASAGECDREYFACRGLGHDVGLLVRAIVLWPFTRGRVKPQDKSDSANVIADVAFHNVDMNRALELLEGALGQRDQPCHVAFVNPACVNIAARDQAYLGALQRASLVLPDGMGIRIAASLLGDPLRQNVNGTDLFPRLMDLLARRKGRLFLLGGMPGVADAVAEQVRRRWPDVQLSGWRDGFFSLSEESRVVSEVAKTQPDVVLVARGVPTQELFIDRHLHEFRAPVVMGVGGLFDFVSGRISRAPQWMRDSGLEWVWRLIQEPGRMWQRYLVGNLSFLARVALQRVGLRKRQQVANAFPAQVGGRPVATGRKAVLWACEAVHASIPQPQDQPAALLPLGCASFVERALEQLAQAGIEEVHLIVRHRPEALRQVIGFGERWGLQVRWHAVGAGARRFEILQALPVVPDEWVLLGHAERNIGQPDVTALAQAERTTWVSLPQPSSDQGWSGWARANGAQWAELGRCESEAELLGVLRRLGDCQTASQMVSAGTARQVQHAQHAAMATGAADWLIDVPASWIRTPWGAMSPSARVNERAQMRGPAIVGPGCMVDAGAVVGPDVVLTRDTIVMQGAVVQRATVLPNTFIGQGLLVEGATLAGRRMFLHDLDVAVELEASDALTGALRAQRSPRTGAVGRAAAGLAWLVLTPLHVLDVSVRRAQGRPPRMELVPVAVGQERPPMRLHRPHPHHGPGKTHWLLARAALAEVWRGQRSWMGRRAISPQEWAQLPPDWHAVLAEEPIGLLHAPAWRADGGTELEAEAAADLFLAAQSPAARRWLLLKQLFAAPEAAPVAEADLVGSALAKTRPQR